MGPTTHPARILAYDQIGIRVQRQTPGQNAFLPGFSALSKPRAFPLFRGQTRMLSSGRSAKINPYLQWHTHAQCPQCHVDARIKPARMPIRQFIVDDLEGNGAWLETSRASPKSPEGPRITIGFSKEE